jgi:hypothetical protein
MSHGATSPSKLEFNKARQEKTVENSVQKDSRLSLVSKTAIDMAHLGPGSYSIPSAFSGQKPSRTGRKTATSHYKSQISNKIERPELLQQTMMSRNSET